MDIDLQIGGLGWIFLDLTATKFAIGSQIKMLRQIYSQPRSRKKSSKIKTQIKEIYGILHDSLYL